MGSYAQVKDATELAAQMRLVGLDCADVARQVNALFGTPARPQVVSRQFVSRLKTGKTKRCTPTLATSIASVLGVIPTAIFAMHEPRMSVARSSAQVGAAA